MENATSYTSPLATVKYGAVNVPWQLDYVVDAVSNASGWQIALTILALLVAYDQCMSLFPMENKKERGGPGRKGKLTVINIRLLSLAQGPDRRADDEAALHWTFPAICQPQVRRILREVVQRPP